MVSARELKSLVKLAQEAWQYLKRIHQDVSQHGRRLPLRDDEQLLLESTTFLLFHKSADIKEAEKEILDQFKSTISPRPMWNTLDEKCERFLGRVLDNIVLLLEPLKEVSLALEKHQTNFSMLNLHCDGASNMAYLLHNSRPVVKSDDWTCDQLCTARDHFHTTDGYVWPRDESDLDRKIPVGSRPLIQFKEHELTVLPSAKHFDDVAESGEEAVRQSILQNWGSDIGKLRVPLLIFQLCAPKMKSERGVVQVIASLSVALSRGLNDKFGTEYELGVVLPGNSRILYPDDRNLSSKLVLIKVNERLHDSKQSLCFQPVIIGDSLSKEDGTQTMPFLDLPAEIRNMIYERVLEQTKDSRNPKKMPTEQPAISRTCKAVNKEVMGLLWQKYGWVVC